MENRPTARRKFVSGSGPASSGGGFGDLAMTAMFVGLISAYIGSYSVPLGEIESVCVDDGHLVILINKGTDVIYRTKDRVGI